MPQYFEVYQGMDEKLKKKVFADMQACERFVKRDKDTREEVRTWMVQLNVHLDCLIRFTEEEKQQKNDEIMLSILRRKHLSIIIDCWHNAEISRLEELRLSNAKKNESIFTKLARPIVSFFQRRRT